MLAQTPSHSLTRIAQLQLLQIMDASLHFISELLRNMLDVHRAESQQMKLDYKPTDVKRDVLEPVAAVLCMRGSQVSITIDCPEDLVVSSDRMRLKQMILNLAANATKFVASGYIRLRGDVVNGSVQLAVEDSGPGMCFLCAVSIHPYFGVLT